MHERLVLANAVCAEVEVSSTPSGPLISAALALLRDWVRVHTPPDDGEVHPCGGLGHMVVPDGSEDLMVALELASRVCEDVATLYTADTPTQYESDSRRTSASLENWLESKEPARSWSAERRAKSGRVVAEEIGPNLSPVQRVAVSYGAGAVEIADVLSAIARAHRRRGFDPTAPSGTGPGEELDSWTGVLNLPSQFRIPEERLDALREAYGPFAQQKGWLIVPKSDEGSNRDPDNPFYRGNAFAKFAPEERAAILFGVGLGAPEEVVDTMWVDPETGEPISDSSGGRERAPNACLVSSRTLDGLYFGHQISSRQLSQLQAVYSEARSGRVRDGRIPHYEYESDYDGAQFMLIDPESHDMAGWSLTIDYGYSINTYPFELMTAYRSGGHWSLIMAISEPLQAWSAFAGRRARLTFLVTPEGERIQM